MNSDELVKEPTTISASSSAQNSNVTTTMIDKSIQVNMDMSPDEDPKKNKKYWQDLAGLRGAREEYLKFDISELAVENNRLANSINYLYAKLKCAEKQISDLEAKKCRCRDEDDRYAKPLRSFCL